MSVDFDVTKQTLREIAQSLLECKKMGRSIESTADTFMPLANDDSVKEMLSLLSGYGKLSADMATMLYQRIARDAMKDG